MPDPRSISVLYVDDEPALLEVTKMFLEKTERFSVTTAVSVAEAGPLLASCRFDAIVSDYQMPVTDGIEFLKQVRSTDPLVPFILFTGKGREEIAVKAINNGATFYLQKGGDVKAQFAELAHRLGVAVSAARAEEELKRNFIALREQEQLLKEREAYYRAVFENTGTAMVVIDSDTTIRLANGESERLFGYPREMIEGNMRWPDLVPEPERARMVAWHHARREKGGEAPRDYVSSIVNRSGRVRAVRITVGMIPGSDRSVASLIDITDQAKADEALRQSEMIHRTIFEMSPEPIVLTTAEGIISYVSPASLSMFGLSSEKEALKTSLLDWIVPEKREDVGLAVRRFMQSGMQMAPPALYPLHRKDGSRFYAEISSSKLTGPEGKTAGLVSIIRDVTDRITAESALRKAGEKLNLLSSITRHDIHNKLMVLMGYIELARVAKDPGAVSDFLRKIDEITTMLSEQIEFTKDYQELGVHSPAWQGLSAIVARAGRELGTGEIRIADDLGYLEIFADPLLVKVVYNLIDNAIRHGGHVSTIRFAYEDRGNELVLTVGDDGEGVAVEDKDRIFSKGFGKNTGFGLFLVREILAITGMTIAETGFPGKGARFEIRVPAEDYRFRRPQGSV